MTIPIFINRTIPKPDDAHTSLCYQVHGEAHKFFNLISDECTAVNAHYIKAAINNSRIDLNVLDAIGVKAFSSDGVCHTIRVDLDEGRAIVDGVAGSYRRSGVTVRMFPNSEDCCTQLYAPQSGHVGVLHVWSH